MNKKILWGLAILGVVLGGWALVGGNHQSAPTAPTRLGGMTNYDGVTIVPVESTDGLKVGSSGTTIAKVNRGTCYIKPSATTIAASSTAEVDCQATRAIGSPTGASAGQSYSALPGITYGDVINATLASSTAKSVLTQTGITLSAAEASSTSGYIVLTIVNNSGTTYTWPTTGTASGTAYYFSTR